MKQLILEKPVLPFHIHQMFGENEACINNKTNEVIAWSGTCPAGYRGLYKNMLGHNGLDLQASHGQEVRACHDGIVCEVVNEKDRGLGLGIVTSEKYFCNETKQEEYFKTRYWHHLENKVTLGDKVKKGQVISLADNSGYSAGDHLHLEIKPVKIIKEHKGIPVVENLLQDNGYFGAVNPIPYLGGMPHLFYVDMKMSQTYDREVEKFQDFLITEGLMEPVDPKEKGYYGKKTQSAVFEFQDMYVGLSWYERHVLKGSKIGQKTRNIANTIIMRKHFN